MSEAAWLVDLDGTLYDPVWVRLGMSLELGALGWGAVRTVRAFRKAHEELRAQLVQAGNPPLPGSQLEAAPEESPYQQQLAMTAERVGASPDAVGKLVERWMIERPLRYVRLGRRRRLIKEVQGFRQRGGRTALVSDYPARRKLQALGVEGLFDVIVANGELGGPARIKPAPDGYLLAAQRLGVAPGDCLVVGDRDDTDGAAAGAAGMAYRKI